jgi:hypothetical protein
MIVGEQKANVKERGGRHTRHISGNPIYRAWRSNVSMSTRYIQRLEEMVLKARARLGGGNVARNDEHLVREN